MRADCPVVLDACALAPANLCDLLLSLAESPRLYVPRWSEEILTEVKRTHSEKLHWPQHLVDLWQTNVRAAFPEAMVEGYEQLKSDCTNHEKDRHVLAAAIHSRAELIVTTNLKHFPFRSLEPWGIAASHPSSFLIEAYTSASAVVFSKLDAIARRRQLPADEVLARLGKSVPAFTRHVAKALGWKLPEIRS
jgi:predicted nucleic acid-binding protein